MSDFSPSAMGAMVPPDSPMERLRGLSGLFDGDLFAAGLGPGEKAFQIVLISWMALVGLLAALRTRELLRMRGELEASM